MNSQTINLYGAKKKGTFYVKSVPDVGLLKSLGLRAGSEVKLQHRYAFGGPVLLSVGGEYQIAIGKDIAKQIAVGEVDDDDRL